MQHSRSYSSRLNAYTLPNRRLLFQALCVVLLAFLAQSCYRCKPIGNVCDSTDNSVIVIDKETYFFSQERITENYLRENDSEVVLHYSLSRNVDESKPDKTVGFGFIVSLTLGRLPNNGLAFKYGAIEFIKNNVGGDVYHFQSPQLEVSAYQCCACGSPKPGMPAAGGPAKLLITLKGTVWKDGVQKKEVNFRVQYTTQKAPVEAC